MSLLPKRWEPGEGPQRYIRELEAEIERLKASVPTEIAKGTYALAVEIARLKAALRGLLGEVMCFSVDPPSAALNHAIEEASAALEHQYEER